MQKLDESVVLNSQILSNHSTLIEKLVTEHLNALNLNNRTD